MIGCCLLEFIMQSQVVFYISDWKSPSTNKIQMTGQKKELLGRHENRVVVPEKALVTLPEVRVRLPVINEETRLQQIATGTQEVEESEELVEQ